MLQENMLRVGLGYDSHKLVKGRTLFLGGVKIDSDYGLEGHSDADVVLHSICDALLGACGLADIGELFPNTDKKYKNISSKILAKNVLSLLEKNKFKVINIDSVVICDKPRISTIKDKILRSLKGIFKTEIINIKGKTLEGESSSYIKVYSVALIKRIIC